MQIPNQKKKITLSLISGLLFITLITISYLWNSQTKELKQNRDLDSQKIQELEKKLNELSKESPTEQSSGNFLEIEQWGVKVNLSRAPKGTRYTIGKSVKDIYGDQSSKLLWQASEKDELGQYCSEEESATVSIIRSSKPSVTIREEVVTPNVTINNNYYYIEKDLSGGPCIPEQDYKEGDSAENNPKLAKEAEIHKKFIELSESLTKL